MSIRITPACAGSTDSKSNVYGWVEDHPRLRGEYERTAWSQCSRQGSPPLARGVPGVEQPLVCFVRITPACAGSTDC